MKRLAASLILLFIASWSYAQNDLTIYRKNGKKVEMKNATTETRGSNVYITDGNNKTKVFFQSSLDSITGLPEGVLNFNAVEKTVVETQNEIDDFYIKYSEATPLDDEIIEIKKDLNEFRKARGGGYFLQALGAGIAIAGSYLVISDANNETFTGTSKGLLLTGVGSGLSLVGFILTWGAGDKINYDNDIAKHKKKRKNR
ncbi:hypothetical protein N9487_03235 [Cyclobacteriaceae bacterium]|nr:hypothetical protein [Cyclobacteriaceae bacterium]